MRQFDVIPLPTPKSGAEYLVILQHDAIDQRGTVVVAPCIPASMGPRNRRLTPEVDVGGKRYVVTVGELTSIERRRLSGRAVANLAAHRDAFISAIDLVFTGV